LDNFRDLQSLADWRGFDRLTPLSEALTALAACCVEIAPVKIEIENAVKRIVAAPIHAPISVPPYPIALGEGWAVAAQDTVGASSYAPAFADRPPHRVGCGDRLPERADAVLPLSAVNEHSSPIEILCPTAPGRPLKRSSMLSIRVRFRKR